MPDGSEGHYFSGRIRGGDAAAISSTPAGAPPLPAWNTYIWVDSADDAVSKAQAAGGSVIAATLRRRMDAGRMAVLVDPRGRAHRRASVLGLH